MADQAEHLARVRRAASIGRRESVAAWLHKVAYRVALASRAAARRRETAPPVASSGSLMRKLPPILLEVEGRRCEVHSTIRDDSATESDRVDASGIGSFIRRRTASCSRLDCSPLKPS